MHSNEDPLNYAYRAGEALQLGSVLGSDMGLKDFDRGAKIFAPSPREETKEVLGGTSSQTLKPGEELRTAFRSPVDSLRAFEVNSSLPLNCNLIDDEGSEILSSNLISGNRNIIHLKEPLKKTGGKVLTLSVKNSSNELAYVRTVDHSRYPILNSDKGIFIWIKFHEDDLAWSFQERLRRAFILIKRGEYKRLFGILKSRLAFLRYRR